MSEISIGKRSYQDKMLLKLACLGLATGGLLWLLQSAVVAQSQEAERADENLIAQAVPQVQVFVNPSSGNDSEGKGSQDAPFKTITQALQAARPNTTIVLAQGTYSAKTGESFPLRLKAGVTIQGNPGSRGQGIKIEGGGQFLSPAFARQDATILAADLSSLTGVTVSNPNPRGYGVWIESSSAVVADNTFSGSTHDGISVTGTGAAVIRGNSFSKNGGNGITIYGTSRPDVRDNVFEDTGFGINIGQNAAPLLVGNKISRNKDGVVVQGNARPVLRNNQIEGNQRDGVVAIAGAIPDLGSKAQPGGNVIRNNGQFDVNCTAAKQTIPAFGNKLASDRTVGNIDFAGVANASSGGVQVAGNPQRPTPGMLPPVEPKNPPPLTAPPSQPGGASIPRPRPTYPLPPAPTPAPNPGDPVQIPVPTPQGGSTRPLPRSQQGYPPGRGDRGDTLPTLLPVPNPNAPIGDAGDLPQVVVASRPSSDGPPPPPTRAALLGFRYRVIVKTSNDRVQDRVRSLVSDAFRTELNGEEVMQVGLFNTEDKAKELVGMLKSKGIVATILSVQ